MNPTTDEEHRATFIKKPGFTFGSAAAETIIALGILADASKKLRDDLDLESFIRATEEVLRQHERPSSDPDEERKRSNIRRRAALALRLAKAAHNMIEAWEAAEA